MAKTLLEVTKQTTRDTVLYIERIMNQDVFDANEVDRQVRIDVLKTLCNIAVILAHIEEKLPSVARVEKVWLNRTR